MHSLSWIVSYLDCQGFNSINQHERVWLSPDMYFAVSPQEGARIIFKSTLNRTCRWPITANKVIFVPNHFLIGIFAVLLTTPEARKTKFTLRIFKIFSDLGLSLLLLVLLRILMLLLMIYINDMNEERQTREFSVKPIMSMIDVFLLFYYSFCCWLNVIVNLLPVTGHQMATLMLNVQIPPLQI